MDHPLCLIAVSDRKASSKYLALIRTELGFELRSIRHHWHVICVGHADHAQNFFLVYVNRHEGWPDCHLGATKVETEAYVKKSWLAVVVDAIDQLLGRTHEIACRKAVSLTRSLGFADAVLPSGLQRILVKLMSRYRRDVPFVLLPPSSSRCGWRVFHYAITLGINPPVLNRAARAAMSIEGSSRCGQVRR